MRIPRHLRMLSQICKDMEQTTTTGTERLTPDRNS